MNKKELLGYLGFVIYKGSISAGVLICLILGFKYILGSYDMAFLLVMSMTWADNVMTRWRVGKLEERVSEVYSLYENELVRKKFVDEATKAMFQRKGDVDG